MASQADFDDLQHTGGQLISLVGGSEKPEVKKNMDDTETTLGEINEKVRYLNFTKISFVLQKSESQLFLEVRYLWEKHFLS